MRFRLLTALTGTLLILSACSGPKPIVVGSKDTVEQRLLGEIAAQHLEHRLGIEVKRQLGLGGTGIVYQSLLDGQIDLYPEYSGIVIRDLLKEPPGIDPDVILERARVELKRRSLLEYTKPLGFDNRTVLVIASAGNEGLRTASEAAATDKRWKIGFALDREASLPGLNAYSFRTGAPLRSMKSPTLFSVMEEGAIDVVMTGTTDGHLASPKWKVLEDDKHAFFPADAAFVVRDDVFTKSPDARAVLDQLAGKISLDAMRKMNAAVEIDERPLADVAAEFIKSAGLN